MKSIWWISDDIERILIKTSQDQYNIETIIVETIEEFKKYLTPDFYIICSVINVDNNYDDIKKLIENNSQVNFHFIYRLDNNMLTFKESSILNYPNTESPTSIDDLFSSMSKTHLY